MNPDLALSGIEESASAISAPYKLFPVVRSVNANVSMKMVQKLATKSNEVGK
jgi:hypothetical protein